MSTTLLCSILVGLSVVTLAGQKPSRPQTGKAFELATAMAKDRVSGGVIVPEADFRPGPPLATSPQGTLAGPMAADLTGSLDTFNGGQRALRAVQTNGIVHVRAVNEPTALREFLDRWVTLDAEKPTTVSHAVLQLFVRELNPSWSPAVIGTGIMPAPGCGLDRPVTPTGKAESLIKTLDGIIRQTPGVVWFMTYDPEAPLETLRVGLLCPDGVYLRTKIFNK